MGVTLVVSEEADADLVRVVNEVSERFGYVYGARLGLRLNAAVNEAASMPSRHMRVRALLNRRYEYRRVLSGRHRIIFTLNESQNEVRVVRVDLQNSDPATLEDLP